MTRENRCALVYCRQKFPIDIEVIRNPEIDL